MCVIKEPLQGIRQIKFVTSEAQWLERIGDRRAEELRHLFRSFILRTTLVAIWALGPVMISAVALSVHTILTGRLSASVAFTSLAALSQMESALAIIPMLVVHMLEDAVSATRIECYLDSAEIANNAEHGDTVSMVNASVSRPSHSTAQIRSTFVPRSADIVFTSGKLNVISGVSGSGKSLLLAAIVGEGETVSGAMRLPKSMKYKDDLRLISKDWIVPGSIAFVAQFRWIENDSVRGNIVFGLPFDLDRYTKVLHACALNHDLHVLPDGDLTDVGFGGVNLSGGQKWRVSFALAMYSRAEILVLDDILSAVNVHSWWINIWTRTYADNSALARATTLHKESTLRIFLTDNQQMMNSHYSYQSMDQGVDTLYYYIGVYLGLSLILCLLFVVKYFSVLGASIRASRVLFERFSSAVLHAPGKWLDATPPGRIYNRYTADFGAIDESMADGLGFLIDQILQLNAIAVAAVIVSPMMIVILNCTPFSLRSDREMLREPTVSASLVAALTVWRPEFDASLAGFVLSFALQYTTAVKKTICQYSSTQMGMNSTERILEYSYMETQIRSGQEVTNSWPAEGEIHVEGFSAGYEAERPILSSLSFHVAPKMRIGVVGRTGASKSSLALSLFRFLEAVEGSIMIDGIDISTVWLQDFRSRLAIIPQDPVLFAGTLRSNLDPLENFRDEELNNVAHETFGSLSFPISGGGYNLSQGQRQLLCLARALLSRRKIVVMDEATSGVDRVTDELIQHSIRRRFKDSTLLVIVRRLSTVAEFDAILVLDNGKIVEYDKPNLLMEKRGTYWEMIQQSSERVWIDETVGSGQGSSQ
ncbi:MAG: hypothetical protein Q9186_000183 [Xanthomendoza sp. 1 TL-2023]